MRSPSTPELIASCWTSAGNVAPLSSPETSPVPITDRLDALASTGWAGFGLAHDDLVAVKDSIGFPELRKLIDGAGFDHVEVELLSNWWDESRSHEWQPQLDLLLDAAEALGASFIKVGTAIGDGMDDYGLFVAPLQRLTKEAARRGTRIALEPMAFSEVRSIPRAADLMRTVDLPGCGLVVDYWHVFRHGTSHEELAESLTADQVFAVELNDADSQVRGTLFEDTRDRRRLCGEGEQDVTGFIRTIQDLGFRGPWGVEILSEAHRALPVRAALESAYSTAMACFPA